MCDPNQHRFFTIYFPIFLLVFLENLYQTLKAVFDYLIKALKVRQK